MCVDMGGGGSHFRERWVHRGFMKRGVNRGFTKRGVHRGVHKKGGSREPCEPPWLRACTVVC